MEASVFDILEALNINSEQINFSLLYENELLSELDRAKHISELSKQKLDELVRLHKKVSDIRKEINQLHLAFEQKQKEDARGDIGIIYSKKHKKILFSILQLLNDLAKKHEINFICFRLADIDIETNQLKGIFISCNGIKDITTKIPPLIYNMGFYTKVDNLKKMNQLRTKKGITVINPLNRFNQYILRDMISPLLKKTPILLPYTTFSMSNLNNYLEEYETIYLVPEKIGTKKIFAKIEKRNVEYILTFGSTKKILSKDDIYEYIITLIENKKYFLMKGIKPIKFNSTPIEARIYLQKGDGDNWGITQMVAKHEFFCEKSIYKDTCYLLTDVLNHYSPLKSQEIVSKLTEVSLNICTYLEKYLNNMGSCVLDFIIAKDGRLYFMYFSGGEENEFLMSLDNGSYWWKHFAKSLDYLIHLKKGDLS